MTRKHKPSCPVMRTLVDALMWDASKMISVILVPWVQLDDETIFKIEPQVKGTGEHVAEDIENFGAFDD